MGKFILFILALGAGAGATWYWLEGRHAWAPVPAEAPAPAPTEAPAKPAPKHRMVTVPAEISGLRIIDDSEPFGPKHQAFGNCYKQGKTAAAISAEGDGSFETRFQLSVGTDCEVVATGGGGVTASLDVEYGIDFTVGCPAGSRYEVQVESTARGAFTIKRDNFDGCDLPFFGATGKAEAFLTEIRGSLTGAKPHKGKLELDAPAGLATAEDGDRDFEATTTAVFRGRAGTEPMPHTLRYSWKARCESQGNNTDTGAECAVRMGLPSDLSPNGIRDCYHAGEYPGDGSREADRDGHIVRVKATCRTTEQLRVTAPTEPGGLGKLRFTVKPGEDAYCPGDGAPGSFLKTHGNPSGGIPGRICNGTQGDFTNGPLVLQGGAPGDDGRATLDIAQPTVIGAHLESRTPGCGSSCMACWRFASDPSREGFIDCDGGSSANLELRVDRGAVSGRAAFDPGWLSLSGSGDSGPGAAVLPISLQRLRVNDSGSCPPPGGSEWAAVPVEQVTFSTGQARAHVAGGHACQGSVLGTKCPTGARDVGLRGANFTCDEWASDSGAQLVLPLVNLDEEIGGSFTAGDIAQVLRLVD